MATLWKCLSSRPSSQYFKLQYLGPCQAGGATDGWDKCLFWSSQESHCWPGGVIVSVWRRRLAALVSGTGNFNPRSYWICFINLSWIHKVSSIQITSKRVVSGFWCSFGSPILFLMYISKYHCMTIWAHLPRVWPPLGFLKADIQTNVSPPNPGTSPLPAPSSAPSSRAPHGKHKINHLSLVMNSAKAISLFIFSNEIVIKSRLENISWGIIYLWLEWLRCYLSKQLNHKCIIVILNFLQKV